MDSKSLRKAFLDYFVRHQHREVASSPLVLPRDPTLLFANAGMNQFKDVFTGRESRDYTRATTSQKCLRVAGKHNDLEMVGRTPRHHTFFEMLGNFSFGDYFKEEAIALAWKFLREELGIPEERLWVSVFGGSEQFPADTEAEQIWIEKMGVSPDRILRLGEKENFWRMGDTGPCGPCSEIHYDLGEALTSVKDATPNPENDERRFLEIWNLVFMQYDQQPDALNELPAPSIDTGMGLERIASVMQGVTSNYDTDIFQPLLQTIAKTANKVYGEDEEIDTACRVIADHSRAFSFLVADGIVPSGDNRGYVLRRLLRRAIRFGRKLGIDKPFLHHVTPVVIEQMEEAYPELRDAQEAILEVGKREEQRFAATLSAGLDLLDQAIEELPSSGERVLAGETIFRLYDTFGFPLDLTQDIAEERDVTLDLEGFDTEMEKQRTRARESFKAKETIKVDPAWQALADEHPTEFLGYDSDQVEGVKILALRAEGEAVPALNSGMTGEVVLEATPFYAESGGQVGDTGRISQGDSRALVLDTQRPVPGLIVHKVKVEKGTLEIDSRVDAVIDAGRRQSIARNHTATHLLHAALREVIGTHVKQAGSLVAPDRLRFDFSHFAGISESLLSDIESRIEDEVLANHPVETEVMDIDSALKAGAMALFGEKYGDKVRVVKIGPSSLELCGGIHVEQSGEVGLFKFLQEKGIAAGTRRVEGTTGPKTLERLQALQSRQKALEKMLSSSSDDVMAELEKRLEAGRAAEKELEKLRVGQFAANLEKNLSNAKKVAGVSLFTERVDGLASKEARELADRLRRKLGSGVVVLGRADGEKASLLVAVTDDLKERLPAGQLVKALATHIKGGGGGRPDLAEAGGKDPANLSKALEAASEEVERRLA